MPENPVVSFLMPVYNAERTVRKAVRSVLGQHDAPPLELVAVDDGSTDSTCELLEDMAAVDSRLRVLSLSHRGQVAAAVAGQKECRGEFIARMDADDIAHPQRIALQVSMLHADASLGAVGSMVRYFPRRRLRIGLAYYERWLNTLLEEPAEAPERIERELFVECPLANPSVTFRREAFEQAGGYRDFDGLPEDYDLLLRLAGLGWKLGGVPRLLHYWRDSGGRASRKDPRYSEENFRRLKLHYLLRQRLDGGARPVSICGAGPVGKAWLKALRAAGVEVRYLVEVNPRKIGKKIHNIPVISVPDLAEAGDHGLILGAVGQKGARGSVRASFAPLGLREGPDYIFLA